MTRKKKKIIRLVGANVVLIGCIFLNYYGYLLEPNRAHFIVTESILVLLSVAFLCLLKSARED